MKSYKTRDKWVKSINELSVRGEHLKVLQILYTLLTKNPGNHEARGKLRNLMPAKMTASIAELTSGFENFLKAKNSDIIMAAASGWQYSKTLDGRFIEPSLNLESKKSLLEEYTEDYFFKKK